MLVWPFLQSGRSAVVVGRNDGMWYGTGVIDVITPPSITMIIYGIAAQQSVPHLFLAGFPAGILIGVALALYVVRYARVEKIPITAPAQRKDIITHLKDSIWSLLATR